MPFLKALVSNTRSCQLNNQRAEWAVWDAGCERYFGVVCVQIPKSRMGSVSTADKQEQRGPREPQKEWLSSTHCVSAQRPLAAVCARFRGVGMQPVRPARGASCLRAQESLIFSLRATEFARCTVMHTLMMQVSNTRARAEFRPMKLHFRCAALIRIAVDQNWPAIICSAAVAEREWRCT